MLASSSEPYLVSPDAEDSFCAYAVSHGAPVALIDLSLATSSGDVIDVLKGSLEFPLWCGSGWDSMEDAFEELRAAWDFPLVLLVRGGDELVITRPQLALEVVLRLGGFSHACSVAGDQLIVVYVWRPAP